MGYTLLSEKFPVASRNHRCIWCGQWIEQGEKYRDERSIYEGNFQSHRWHLECDKDFQEGLKYGADTEFEPYANERPTL